MLHGGNKPAPGIELCFFKFLFGESIFEVTACMPLRSGSSQDPTLQMALSEICKSDAIATFIVRFIQAVLIKSFLSCGGQIGQVPGL